MQIPIINGSFTDEAPDFRSSYPRNMVPVPKKQGISNGYLRPSDGIAAFGVGPGVDRGAVTWNKVCYRVMGSSLVKVDASGNVTVLGTIAGAPETQCTLDYSFDRLSVSGGGKLYYWNGVTLTQVIDTDLGYVVDHLWVDGYFMTTDGFYLIVTELNDPTSVNPLKYGSSEADPDPILGLFKLRNEVYALNRNTIEQFNNVGGSLFPFQRNEGAQIQRGVLGTHCAAIFMDAIAFLGGARNEAPSIWVGNNGSSAKIATREIDTILMGYTEGELSLTLMEARVFKGHELLYLHLPDQTLVYDGNGSQVVGEPVWYTLTSSVVGLGKYRARNILWCYDKWLSGDPTGNTLGELVDTVSTHYGDKIGWEFNTPIIYNESLGAVFHMLELVTLPGRIALGVDPVVWTSYSLDGELWSQERACNVGKQGARDKRATWLNQGSMRNWRIQRFRGTSDAHLSIARLEAKMEPLNA
ncbi:MAG: packaged DNA stabilization protein [Pseudomonadota bacterium]